MTIQRPVRMLVQRTRVTIVDVTGLVVQVVQGYEDNYAVAKAIVDEINSEVGDA